MLASLLDRLGALVGHPGLMQPHSIDSVGMYIDADNRDQCRARLVSGTGLQVVYKIRQFEVLLCEAADKLSWAQRRQCLPVRGTNEVARRLDPTERGAAEIVVSFPGGGTLALRRNRDPRRMVVLLTSTKNDKKILESVLPEADVPRLAALFDEAAKGQRQVAVGPSTTSREVKLENGSFWILPAWYTEAVALLAQDVFRLHAVVSATAKNLSRALYFDCVTAHRIENGPITEHHTLIKGTLHRASGGCVCCLHRSSAPKEPFKRLEFRMEFCGCVLVEGKCKRHCIAETVTESARFPGICMKCLKVEFRCTHEKPAGGRGGGGVRIPLNVEDPKMDLAYTKDVVMGVASCGARLMSPCEDKDLPIDMTTTLASLEEAQARNSHMGDSIRQHDVVAVYLLRQGTTVNTSGRFGGRVRADCNAILKTHKHLFKVKSS